MTFQVILRCEEDHYMHDENNLGLFFLDRLTQEAGVGISQH